MNNLPKILVLDNVQENIQSLSEVLNGNGYEVFTSDNDQNFSEILESYKPDLILLDIMMSGFDDYEVYNKLKQNGNSNTPVILVIPEEKVNEVVSRNNGVDYITKPFRSAEILTRINTHLKVKVILEQKNALQKELQTLQRMTSITALAGGIAHNINNLMGAIVGYSDLLRSNLNDNPKSLDYTERILEASQRVTELTRNLLTYSRSVRNAPTRVKVKNLLEDIILLYGSNGAKRLSIDLHVPLDIPEIYVDRDQVCKALASIYINAEKSAPKDSIITIIASIGKVPLTLRPRRTEAESEEYVVLSITDMGSGIDEEIAQKLSDSFFSMDHVIESELELSAASGIVLKNKGFIHVQTKPDIGSTFHVYLPKAGDGKL
jgi:signal transduction histidine kinase